MKLHWLFATALFVASLCLVAPARADLSKDIEISYKKFVLKNGLTLVVHEDNKSPIVAVNVWYHVGSKNENPGKTGFAHLFEHLMFNGSENFNDDYFKAVEKVGATDLNGTTSKDRTNYFQNAPKEALDFLLWLESDRMGHMLGAIDQAKLDEQRGVVQNEKRQYENQPYGIAHELITKGTYPPGHPYSWTVIGSMEDLNAASLDDVKEWFNTYYGAANATLVVAGDVQADEVLKKVETYFGSISSGPPIAKHEKWIAKRSGTQRQIAQDRVPQSRIYKAWNIPAFGDKELDYLNLASDVLAAGKTSRLYKRLVYDEQIATSVSAYVAVNEIGSQFFVVATARPGESLEKIEKAIDEEMARFLAKGPSAEELERAKTQQFSGFIRGIERIGGFGGKSDILAMNQTYAGHPDFYKTTLNNFREARVQDVQNAAKKWLSDGVYILEIHPFPKYESTKSEVDRSKLPVPTITPEVKFPVLQRTNLSNGLKVVLAERSAVPLINFTLQVDAGYAADQFASPGTAKLAMDMLDEGTKRRNALQISDELDRLGASLNTGSDLDTSSVALSALKANLNASLDIFADVILNPSFPASDFERLKKQQLDAIQREKSEPSNMALRILPELLYGDTHAYSIPFTGSGTAEAVSKLKREDAEKFYRTWFKPNNATLIIAGDAKLSEIVPKLEKLFATWKSGSVPKKNFSDVDPAEKSVIYLLDRPGSLQSMIFAGHLAPPKANPDEIAIETMNNIFGGTFTSRINMNLREDKHWSYGARSSLVPARAQRPFLVVAPVQTDKTKESIIEINKELRGILGQQPITSEEVNKAQQNQTLKLPGTWETISRVESSVAEIVRFGLPDKYFETYADKVLALDQAALQKSAAKVIQPDQLTWVVVGDRAKVESGLRELGFGEIRLIDADGNILSE
ncbi:MAG: insulinase family protein [Verrucomicrobia bacterium]|nr:insulinase family protein [Verrucomicrobiota bacterium]